MSTPAARERVTEPKAAPEPPGYMSSEPDQKAVVSRWLDAIDREPFALETIIKARGYSIRSVAGKTRLLGLRDPVTGTETITATNAPPLYITPGSYPHRPGRIESEVSNFSVTASGLLRELLGADLDELEKFLQASFRGHCPAPQPFYVARHGDEGPVDTNPEVVPEAAIRKALPAEHDGVIDLCRVDALDKGLAVASIKARDVPFKTVRVTGDGRVLELGWHGQPPTLHEQHTHDRLMAEQRREKRAQVDREVEQFRRQRYAAIGL